MKYPLPKTFKEIRKEIKERQDKIESDFTDEDRRKKTDKLNKYWEANPTKAEEVKKLLSKNDYVSKAEVFLKCITASRIEANRSRGDLRKKFQNYLDLFDIEMETEIFDFLNTLSRSKEENFKSKQSTIKDEIDKLIREKIVIIEQFNAFMVYGSSVTKTWDHERGVEEAYIDPTN